MATHVLKTHPAYFEAIKAGEKTFEVRKNDRQYGVGDILILRGWNPMKEEYTGSIMAVRLNYIVSAETDPILSDMLYENHVVMGISEVQINGMGWLAIMGLVGNLPSKMENCKLKIKRCCG